MRQGGTLTVTDSSATANNSITAGTGNTAGQTAGTNLYLDTGVNASFNGTGTSQLSGSISGAGSVTKSNTGTLTLSGTNTYTGATAVNGGTVSIAGSANLGTGSMTFNGGTLQITGSGAVNRTTTLNAGGGTFDINGAGTSVSNSSVISGTGALTKVGDGTLTLTGSNTYTGGTTVSAGLLSGTTSSLKGAITNNASVDFNQTSSGTYAGVISGSGTVIKDGTGNVTFSGANSYSGGTTINGGTLTGSTDSLQGDMLNNATLTFNQTTDGTYGDAISGAGAVTKSGAGNVTFSGTNTYSGGTTVNAGTLTGTTDSLQGNITNKANVTFDQSTSGTYAGNMSGSGSLIKTGAGDVTLSGTNSYTGGTTVNGGTLTINGSTASRNTTVAVAGTLGGIGTINGQVVNNGVVAPGNSLGTLQVNGTYTSNPSSTLQIGFNAGGTTPGVNNGLLNVNGNVSMNGTVKIVAAADNYSATTKYTFLTFSGTGTGTFNGIIDNLPLMNAELIYGNGFVQFELLRNSSNYASLAQTNNQLQVARYLDAINPTATGDLAFVLDQLNLQTAAGARSAFQQMTGEVNGSMAQLGVQNTTQIYLMLRRQLRPSPIMSGGQYAAETDGIVSHPDESEIVLASYNSSTQQIEFVDCSNCCCPQWNGWATGYGLGGNAQGDGNSAGGVYGIGGTVFGLDRSLDCCHTGGIFGAYSALDLTIANPNQSSTANDIQFGSYLRADDGFNYYLLVWSAGHDNYLTSRQIQFGAVNRMASGLADGWQAAGWLERGVHFSYGQCDIQPFLAMQYIYLRQNSFTELGADSLNLQVNGIDTNALRGILGTDVSRIIRLRNGQVLAPELRALWLHEFLEPETSLNSVFAGTGGPNFITRGLNYGRDWAVLGGGINWQVNRQLSVFADYDLQFNAVQAFHVGSGGLEIKW